MEDVNVIDNLMIDGNVRFSELYPKTSVAMRSN